MRRAKIIALLILVSAVSLVVANDYYDHASGVPSTGSLGSSATMRAEFDSIAAGFDKLPTVTGNGDKPVFVNTGGTALEALTAASAITKLGAMDLTSAQTVTGAKTFAGNNILTGRHTIQRAFPELWWRDTDLAVDAGGLWRLEINGNRPRLVRNTAAAGDFSAAEVWWDLDGATGRTIFTGFANTNAIPLVITNTLGNTTIELHQNKGAGAANPIVAAGDAAIIGAGSAIDTGNLTIAPWAADRVGVRMSGGDDKLALYGTNVDLNGSLTLRPAGLLDTNTFILLQKQSGAALAEEWASLDAGGIVFSDWRVNGGNSDYDTRVQRNTGANGTLDVINRGTGAIRLRPNNGVQSFDFTQSGGLLVPGAIQIGGVNVPTVSSTDTLSNKTYSGGTISGTVTNSGTISGGTVNATTLQQGGVQAVTTSGTQTLTNKTFSGGTISGTVTNSGTISGGTISGATLSNTTTNSGTISGGTVSATTISNAVSINVDGSVTSDKACASGYTRIGPNYCLRTGNFSTTALTRDVCTAIAEPASDATAVVMLVQTFPRAANAIALRTVNVQTTANDSFTCSSAEITGVWYASAIEEVARTTGTEESGGSSTQVVPVSASGNVYMQMTDDTGDQGSAVYRIMGYHD